MPIHVRGSPHTGYTVDFTFLGKVWNLKTSDLRTSKYWMIQLAGGITWVPLVHFRDNYRMTLEDNSPMGAILEAKFQILRTRFFRVTPTFHEQYSHYFPTSRSVASPDTQLVDRAGPSVS